ncbi:hypothetical protein PR048_011969 [Dryococelus australis]|uniref:Uncharacterized protein n=1 Tax=Dryococelus australis TaxID=614101 RepID=A0ABQ9HN49_9NEOP|nr:hypothetical protein PR048_011969 [Dryococelus australis]
MQQGVKPIIKVALMMTLTTVIVLKSFPHFLNEFPSTSDVKKAEDIEYTDDMFTEDPNNLVDKLKYFLVRQQRWDYSSMKAFFQRGGDSSLPKSTKKNFCFASWKVSSKLLVRWRTNLHSRLLASHQGEPGSIPGWFTPNSRKWESCRTMSLVGGFSRGSPGSPPFHSGAAPYSPHFNLIGSQHLDVKSRLNLFTHSLTPRILTTVRFEEVVGLRWRSYSLHQIPTRNTFDSRKVLNQENVRIGQVLEITKRTGESRLCGERISNENSTGSEVKYVVKLSSGAANEARGGVSLSKDPRGDEAIKRQLGVPFVVFRINTQPPATISFRLWPRWVAVCPLASISLIGSQDLAVKSRLNLFTPSLTPPTFMLLTGDSYSSFCDCRVPGSILRQGNFGNFGYCSITCVKSLGVVMYVGVEAGNAVAFAYEITCVVLWMLPHRLLKSD